MTWRLGIDLGTNSLGWAALTLVETQSGRWTPDSVMGTGVRIFSDGRNPKDKQSNAAKRREPRSARKNRDRYLRRRSRLMRELVEFGLMPEDPAARKSLEGGRGIALENSDPWILRARALDEQLEPYQIGRAIFHLHQRRGFKSNRKVDRGDNEHGKVHDATRRTIEKMDEVGARTLGELFGRSRLETLHFNQTAKRGDRKPQPIARVRKSGAGAKWQYDYYPTRALIVSELEQIWAAQRKHHPQLLTDNALIRIRDTIEWQHPLKSPPVGKCTLIPTEERAPKALPSAQRARIFQEVNALKVVPTGGTTLELSIHQRDTIANKLLKPSNQTARLTFAQMRKLPDISIYESFNTESEKRSYLVGDETAAKMKHNDRWGPTWLDLDLAEQDKIVLRLLNEESEEKLVQFLRDEYGLDEERAVRVADCPLVAGYGRLSKKALDRILPHLESQITVYSEAVVKAGFTSHSQLDSGEHFETSLPYYGRVLERHVAFGSGNPSDSDEKRYGKIANPTVHVALNQVRAVVNDLIRRFGQPEEIVVEIARDLPLSAIAKRELEKKQLDNQRENDARRDSLRERFNIPDSYENRMRLRLYEDLEALGKRCVFSGQQIGAHNLFSDEVEIEHILPFSRTFDDSYANKTLSMRQANRDKNNRTPYEAFGTSPAGYDWEAISQRAAELPVNKRWRFSPDAMERFEDSERGFQARQLTDTQYISRLTKSYLEALFSSDRKSNVWVIPGKLTSDLRWQWGLDSVLREHNESAAEVQRKNRNDHRHHAIDAVVVGCTDRRMLQRAAIQAKRNEERFDSRHMTGIDEPWAGFRSDVERSIRQIVVSNKPDHGVQSAMHNDTAYGLTEKETNGPQIVVTRKPIDSDAFKEPKDIVKIRDPHIRATLEEATKDLTGAAFKTAIVAAASNMNPPVYRVRITAKLNVIPIKDVAGRAYKAYKGDGNYCYDIWVGKNGKWTGEVISTFDAYQLSQNWVGSASNEDEWWAHNTGRNGNPLKMRLRKGDALQLLHEGDYKIVRVVKFTPGQIALALHFEANVDARTRMKKTEPDALKYIFKAPSSLQDCDAKRVTISPSGSFRIYD